MGGCEAEAGSGNLQKKFLKWVALAIRQLPWNLLAPCPGGHQPFVMRESQLLLLGTRGRPGISKAEPGGLGPRAGVGGSHPHATWRSGQETSGLARAKDFVRGSHVLSSGHR